MQELFEEFIKDGYIQPKVYRCWNTEKGEMVATVWALMLSYLTDSGKAEQERAIQVYGYKHT